MSLERGAFLESARVHGNCYGTLWSEVTEPRRQGVGVILVIDVQGAATVRKRCPDSVSIFLAPPSLAVLEQRLRLRGTEDEATLRRRLEQARRELARRGEYDHVVTNDDLDGAVARVKALLAALF